MAYDSCLNLDNCAIADQAIPSCFDGFLIPGFVDASEAGGAGVPVMLKFDKVNGATKTIETTIDGTGLIAFVNFGLVNDGDWLSEAGGKLIMSVQKADYSTLQIYDQVKTGTSIGKDCIVLCISDQDEITGITSITLTWDE